MPVVMVSSLTERGAEITLRALELGAVDFFTKPSSDLATSFANSALDICTKVKLAALARPRAYTSVQRPGRAAATLRRRGTPAYAIARHAR